MSCHQDAGAPLASTKMRKSVVDRLPWGAGGGRPRGSGGAARGARRLPSPPPPRAGLAHLLLFGVGGRDGQRPRGAARGHGLGGGEETRGVAGSAAGRALPPARARAAPPRPRILPARRPPRSGCCRPRPAGPRLGRAAAQPSPRRAARGTLSPRLTRAGRRASVERMARAMVGKREGVGERGGCGGQQTAPTKITAPGSAPPPRRTDPTRHTPHRTSERAREIVGAAPGDQGLPLRVRAGAATHTTPPTMAGSGWALAR